MNRINAPRIVLAKLAFGLLVSLLTSVTIVTNLQAASGTWTNLVSGNASGSWATAANWNNSVIADGADSTADFSTLDITTNAVVTLDGARTIGNVTFGDTTPSTNWILAAGSAGPLTLAVTAGSPTITANNGSNLITAVLTGVSGVTKAGSGTLRLNTANPNLQNLVLISAGILQIGNATAIGTNGNHTGNDRVICTNSGTLEIIQGNQPNNKHLTMLGAGVGGTQGALYTQLPASGTSTRWGLSSLNGSGVSGNSSVSFPAVTLAGDATIRIDSTASVGAFSNAFLVGYVTGTTNTTVNFTNSFYTLTKTGNGRISFDRGAMVSNIVIQAGSLSPNSASSFAGVQRWTVKSGASLLNWQNAVFNQAAIVEVEAGGVFDVCGRNDIAFGPSSGPFSQNIGFLNGAGTITCGSNGNFSTNIITVFSNSVFTGPINVVTGRFDIIKSSPDSTLILSGTNTYNGVSTVNAGTWLVNGQHTGGMGYTVNAGGILAGSGVIIPPVTLSGAGSVLRAGATGGTLTVSNLTGAGDVFVTNANLTVLGQLNNSGSGSLNSLNLTNSTTKAKLQQGGTEASIYTSTLNVDGVNNILTYTTDNPAVGQFPFIKYNSIGGLNGFAGLTLQNPSGLTASLSNNVANSSIDIVVTAIPALVWRGTPTGDWSIGGSVNWLNGATPTVYAETSGQGPFVIFDDTAAGTSTVNLTTTVTPKGITVNSSSKSYTFTGSGLVSSNGSWLKDGTSTLTLANSGSNNIAGTITVNNGAVSIGNGGTSGNLGGATVNLTASGTALILNRSDSITVPNAISGSGSIVKQAANTATLTGVGSIGGSITVNAGTLALGPAGTITVSGDVTGSGAFGVNGPGTVILSSSTVTYSGGTVITNGTLQLDNAFPPSGSIADFGSLVVGTSGTLATSVYGTGGITAQNSSALTLSGANTYSGPTIVLGGSVDATASTFSPNSALTLGSLSGGSQVGVANFTSGNPTVAGLRAGGNDVINQDTINLSGGSQTLTINGNLTVGNSSPVSAVARLQVTGTGGAVIVNTNGGTVQLGLGVTGSGVNPDYVIADFSQVDKLIMNLGTTGIVNLGTLDGNPGPTAGATVLNQLKLAAVTNYIKAGTINIGAGGRQLVPEFRLGAATNVLNTDTLTVGAGGRDGGYLLFDGATGGLHLRANDGSSRVTMNVGYNPGTGTAASITNTVDVAGHPADLLLGSLIIGDYNNAGVYQNTFTFDTGVLDATSTSLSVIRNNNGNAAASGSTLNINGGTASLGAVNLTASAAYGTLNVANATSLTVSNITSPGSGVATFDINNTPLNLNLGSAGGLATPAVTVDTFNASGTVNLSITGTGFLVGQFPLIKYTGSIGGAGYSALSLVSLPSGVSATLSNNIANASVDLVVTAAPPVVNTNPTNITFNVSGSTLNLSWPPDHKGWTLQTNAVGVANTNQWFPYPGSSSVTNVVVTINPSKANVFFRLVYP